MKLFDIAALAPLGALLCLAALAGPLPAQSPVGETRFTTDPPIRPGDVVKLRIWREPELSGEFGIDDKGVVVLPRIGPLYVLDLSAHGLEERLVAEYETYLRHRSVDVTLLRRIQILGAVRSPGLYPIDATMTLSDAVALAGGATPEGDLKRVQLVRRGERIDVPLRAHTLIAEAAVHSGDQLFVPERSWISRNGSLVGAAVTAGVSLIIAFF